MKQFLRKVGIIAGTVAMAGVAAPLLVPLPPLEDTVSPESLADSGSLFVEIGKIKVHYKRTGERKPVFVLLHGYLRSTFSWHRVLGPLSEIGAVIAYDRPAFGLTSRPMPGDWKGPSPYGRRVQAEMSEQFMDALGIDRAILIGHGMGAGIAALAAQVYPRRVERLVLIDPDPADRGRPGWQRLFMATPQMRRLGPVLLRARVVRQIEEMIPNTSRVPAQTAAAMKDEYQKLLKVDDWDRALWEFARANEPLERLFIPETIQAPTLVIAGEGASPTHNEQIVRIAAAIPHAQLALIPEAGYAPQEETPDEFLQALSEFLDAPQSAVPA